MKKSLIFVPVLIMMCSGGCIFDDGGEKEASISIGQLTLGGGVFLIMDAEYGLAEFGTFDGIKPFTEATVEVNGIKLERQGAIHTNSTPIPIEQLTTSETIRIAIYALGDSVVREITIPEAPVIVKPELDSEHTVGDSLLVEIDYPGEHQLIAMTLTNQEPIAVGFESSEQKMTIKIPGEKLINAGSSILTAYSANTSGEIPENFSIEAQHETFLVATVTNRTVQFVANQ